ncbi:MAG: Ig-like domain-containing protein, partial [Candidatus Enterosoma sp.]|nr:Ig-like domain-containing protein [Mollicutes bacterium]MDY3209914.1 Ig-like domain-containing protein [Candidatus Enterosoma sp.]MDY5852160.1 Ig-like domain-containing protein [Candidatus Enterosoma sp.]
EVDVTPITIDTIKITIKDTTLFVGGTTQATAKITPVDADNKELTWKSSDTKVATIDANGKITALKAGTTEITATSKDSYAESNSITLTVKDKPTGADISEHAGTYSDENGWVQITISKSGVVTIDFDYAYTSAEDYDLTLVSYDGTTFVGENSSLNEQVKLVFQDNGSVDYIYGSEDPVSLSK